MDYQIKQMIGDEKTHRYVLASRCVKPLVVIGVNPVQQMKNTLILQ